MRHWIYIFIVLCVAVIPIAAQDTPSGNTVFFLARDDTNQDGQVTDIDNVRLYEMGLDGTVLFVTPPEQHILLYAASHDDAFKVAVIAQTPTNALMLLLYSGLGDIDQQHDLSDMAYITTLNWDTTSNGGESPALVWEGQQRDGLHTITYLDPITGSIRTGDMVNPDATPTVEINSLRIRGETFLIHDVLNDDLLILQQESLPPEDALWIYEIRAERLTPFNAWVFTEPLLMATHPQTLRVALLGREFDGSMSLYTIDLADSITMPAITPILSGLIDPPYTAMQWTADGTALLLVGDSGDFVVSSIGRIEAVYALDLATGAFTRLSPEGTLVDRTSVTSR